MENFKEKLRICNIVMGISCVVLAVVVVLGFTGVIQPITGDSHWLSSWNGFVSGAATGVMLKMVFSMVQNLRAMKDEKALKKLFIKENDERMKQVYIHALGAAMQVCLILGLASALVAGYFNVTVSLTILGCVLTASFVSVGFKVYFTRKF